MMWLARLLGVAPPDDKARNELAEVRRTIRAQSAELERRVARMQKDETSAAE